MARTQSGGTSPIVVTLWPLSSVDNVVEEPMLVISGAGGEARREKDAGDCGSTKTDTEARPSLNTRCVTDLSPSPRICVELPISRNPAGNSDASQVVSAP